MRERFSRLRTSTVIAAVLALFVTGIVSGAAGDFMVLGEGNNSGTAQTVLQNAGTGAAFTLKSTNVSTGATGIFGWSSSTSANSTRGVYGRADGANSYGVYALQNGGAGTGAAVYADGGLNYALDLRVDDDDQAPIKVNSDGKVVNLNSDQVDNWHMGCPANTTYSQGLCFDNSTRGTATSIYEASDNCAEIIVLGGHTWHLPAANRLLSASRTTSLNIGTSAEWTSDMWIDSVDGWVGLTVLNSLGADISQRSAATTDALYRCATYPYFGDFEFVIFSASEAPSGADEAQIQSLGE